ncbi:MAG: chemotaxis protein CheC [Euryarchaeota archaeon]|nr:chemotaxis protein CheC [Euryarchaeota archaeon]MBU4139622.1 chemotaxis protein CheC [Euryarchaeota archaeon]
MNDIKKLDRFQEDAIKEVGNIGMGHATTSLSKMLDKKIDITLNSIRFVPLVYVPDLVRNEDTVIGVIQQLKGSINGYLLLMLSKDSAKFLTKMMLDEPVDADTFSEMEQSLLKELCNIMSGTYISAISNFLEIGIMLSPPSQVYDMAEAIINQLVGMMITDAENVLFLRTEFNVHTEKLYGKILIFTDTASLAKILDAINRIAAQ